MLRTVLLVAALGSDPIASALDAWAALDSYRVTMHSTLANGESQTVRYHYRKPGFVRMEFVQPHRGALLVYSPQTGEVTLRPFGVGVFPRLNLNPGNPLIRAPNGHTVDQSDVGVLLRNVRALQHKGSTETLGEEAVGGVPALHVRVTGTGRRAVEGVHRYDLWLDRRSLFPVQAQSRNVDGELLESLSMEDPEIDLVFPDGFFDA